MIRIIPGKTNEEASISAANVVADHTARMGLGRIGTIQHVQDQEHSEHKGEGAEYVGQELLREGTSALDLGGQLLLVATLPRVRLLGGISDLGLSLGGLSGGVPLSYGGFGCGGGGYGTRFGTAGLFTALGGGLPRGCPLGGCFFQILVFGHRSTSCSMAIFMWHRAGIAPRKGGDTTGKEAKYPPRHRPASV